MAAMKPLGFLTLISVSPRNLSIFPRCFCHGGVVYFTRAVSVLTVLSSPVCAWSGLDRCIVLLLFSSPLLSAKPLTEGELLSFHPRCSARQPFPHPNTNLRVSSASTVAFDKLVCVYVDTHLHDNLILVFWVLCLCTVFQMSLFHMALLNCQCSHRALSASRPVP